MLNLTCVELGTVSASFLYLDNYINCFQSENERLILFLVPLNNQWTIHILSSNYWNQTNPPWPVRQERRDPREYRLLFYSSKWNLFATVCNIHPWYLWCIMLKQQIDSWFWVQVGSTTWFVPYLYFGGWQQSNVFCSFQMILGSHGLLS